MTEAALAQEAGNDARAAHNRTDHVEERRRRAHWYAGELARREAGTAVTLTAIGGS